MLVNVPNKTVNQVEWWDVRRTGKGIRERLDLKSKGFIYKALQDFLSLILGPIRNSNLVDELSDSP